MIFEKRCFSDTVPMSCFRYAYNVTFRDLNQSVIKALLETTLSDVSLPRQEHSKNLGKVRLQQC